MIEHIADDKRQLIESNLCYMTGMLAVNESLYSMTGERQEAVTSINNDTALMFYIKPLSPEPEPVEEWDTGPPDCFYIGVDTDQNQTICPISYHTSSPEQKKKILYEKLKGRVILFKPVISFSPGDEKVRKNVVITAVEDIAAKEEMCFLPIPVFNMDNADFEKKLLEGSNIIFEEYNHSMPQPEFILCNDYLYGDFSGWVKHPASKRMWKHKKGFGIPKRVKFDMTDEKLKGKIINVNDSLAFIGRDFLQKNMGGPDYLKENIGLTNIKSIDQDISFEYKFIESLWEFTLKENLYYSVADLINLHVCVKTNPLTILSGMSGTGKSMLALCYARMLCLSEEKGNLLFLPISPSYTEPADILGYLNGTNGLYIPADTGLMDLLIRAMDKPDEMHVVIFDEMNLSQVEYWFAPFISLLEKEGNDRRLLLYSPNANCINRHVYKESIEIGDNVRFIGTVNIDETSKDFSDRLLDRANIITLNKPTLKNLTAVLKGNDKLDVSYKRYMGNSFEKYRAWYNDSNWCEAYTDDEIEFLDELHQKISKYDEQKGVSFRITKKIGEYILNIPASKEGQPMLSKEDAFDIQIKQRLITKIKGTEKQFGKLIGTIRDNSKNQPEQSELFDFFNSPKARKVSSFNSTKQEIIRKAKELGVYGYTN
ncbi:AAA domain (dynein-related subfamily) [Oxobacter pfennigii]|uniref:AAA domain (Dynein-related subfamily) n=1 Tax=Oxobacter pfennigii TaxID=36849 RepID=A0A0P8W6G4_9CLOT|nr:AAA family ATPase [Oxobacter pfennigii]KPU43327.1 AAA domain (dynein-related subfamily) [Oxobacter pfennigii]